MFDGAPNFNQDLSDWNVSSGTNLVSHNMHHVQQVFQALYPMICPYCRMV